MSPLSKKWGISNLSNPERMNPANKQDLEMKRDSFKMLLLTVSTQHSRQIYEYFIAFENVVMEYRDYQHACDYYRMLEQVKKAKLEETITNNLPLPSIKVERSINNPENYQVSEDKPVLYIIEVSCIDKMKYGYTNALYDRLLKHAAEFGDITLRYVIDYGT
jgi:hypothetical protein